MTKIEKTEIQFESEAIHLTIRKGIKLFLYQKLDKTADTRDALALAATFLMDVREQL